MKKEFDIKPGDRVWIMCNNIAEQVTVSKIWYSKFINILNYETVEESLYYYLVSNGTLLGNYSPNQIFKTKEDLLKSL
jgi:hypothetical protein